MKITLKKNELMAVVEAASFLVGAIFLLVVVFSAGDAVWAFWIGLVFALAGVILWLSPYIVRLYNKIKADIGNRKTSSVAKDASHIETELLQARNTAPDSGATPITPPAPPQQ
jgi:hypothetical protein